jgi:hypothetical protein
MLPIRFAMSERAWIAVGEPADAGDALAGVYSKIGKRAIRDFASCFEKHGDVVPEAEKQIARDRWVDSRKRMDAKPRRQPCPIGKKAPRKRS